MDTSLTAIAWKSMGVARHVLVRKGLTSWKPPFLLVVEIVSQQQDLLLNGRLISLHHDKNTFAGRFGGGCDGCIGV